MKLNESRVTRYLANQKNINDYLLKITTKNREAMIRLNDIRQFLLQGEQKMRELLQIVVQEKIDG